MSVRRSPPALEVWGGIECTVNRVGDGYLDQLERSGHAERIDDLDLLVALGIRALRYPVLWERVAPDGLQRADWSWPDARLARLRALGVEPIIGLLHHGSGPRSTSLVDPGFPDAFARYARAVAERYPWVRRWTPINEPLTTARFSALYGHWYPHARCPRSFARALVGQCRATVLAMRAIREVIPRAEHVQTEDLGRVQGTPLLRYQAEFENERRWLSFDLLCGLVSDDHPMWRLLVDSGVERAELDWLREQACPPDLLGINHYLTSDRFLDERLGHYPESMHGGNGRHAYADVEAARVCAGSISGAGGALADAWARYQRPLAVTEAHLGCTREQQLRWLHEIWTAALTQRARGVDVRAVTAWSLMGAYDWHVLVTRTEGHYEPGAYDLRSTPPRPTALARMVRDLAQRGIHEHPVLASPGWWRCDERLIYPAFQAGERSEPWRPTGGTTGGTTTGSPGATLLITGATGTLGSAFARLCSERGLSHRLTSRRELDIADGDRVARMLDQLSPWAVVNAAGYVRVDDAEWEHDACARDNQIGPAVLAAECKRRGLRLLTFSSDLVFDGDHARPYVESDRTRPLNAYGRSKVVAERLVLQLMPEALVVRTSAFFGPWDGHNFIARVLQALECGDSFLAACDQVVSPTYVPDLVHAALDLLIDGERGVWHLANAGAVTWAELAVRAAELAGLPRDRVEPCPTSRLGLTAPRPRYSVLASERGTLMPPLEDALTRHAAARASCVQAT